MKKLAIILAAASIHANAATYNNGASSAQFVASVTIQASCTISAYPLNFGAQGILSSSVNAQSSISVVCTSTTPYNIGIDAGSVSGSTVSNRLMAGTSSGNSSSTVSFQIYQDSARSSVWGNQQSANTISGVGTGLAKTIPVYGQIPAQNGVKPDLYQTTLTATVYF